MAEARGLDWPAVMRAGLGGLRLPPEAFWRLTPAELGLMLGLGAVARPLGRAGLEDLLRLYPDGPAQKKEDADG